MLQLISVHCPSACLSFQGPLEYCVIISANCHQEIALSCELYSNHERGMSSVWNALFPVDGGVVVEPDDTIIVAAHYILPVLALGTVIEIRSIPLRLVETLCVPSSDDGVAAPYNIVRVGLLLRTGAFLCACVQVPVDIS